MENLSLGTVRIQVQDQWMNEITVAIVDREPPLVVYLLHCYGWTET